MWCFMVYASPSSVPAANWSGRYQEDPLGTIQVTYMIGTEVHAANPRHRAGDVSPFLWGQCGCHSELDSLLARCFTATHRFSFRWDRNALNNFTP